MTKSVFQLRLDAQLLQQAQQGDQRACKQIYRLYAAPAYSLAKRLLVCPEHARDATQDAFVAAFRKLDKFQDVSPFWSWLKRIVSNSCIDIIRKRKPEASLDSLQGDAHHPRLADTAEQQLLLEQVLKSLDTEDRVVVWLYDVEGFKHREIAKLLGRSISYSKTRLSKARTKLLNADAGLTQPAEKFKAANKL